MHAHHYVVFQEEVKDTWLMLIPPNHELRYGAHSFHHHSLVALVDERVAMQRLIQLLQTLWRVACFAILLITWVEVMAQALLLL